MSLEEEVLAAVRPTSKEREAVLTAAAQLADRVRDRLQEQGLPGEPMVVGSVAKDTFLKEAEIDLFVAFPPETSRDDLERWGLELGHVLDEPTRRYAEHPYTRGLFQGYEADVVPCYKLDAPSERMTAVDRTPFHLAYVQGHLKNPDDVRLLKQFTKGIGTYGAEARVQGFSGYLCELLVLRFRTFEDVLEAATAWRPPVTFHLEGEATRKFPEPLVFVDPVDPGRNAASAVSADSLATFILAAQAYRRAPERVFFFPPPSTPPSSETLRKRLQERGSAFLLVGAPAPDLPEDVLFPQVRKAEQALVAFLRNADFRVLHSQPDLSETEWHVLLELESGRLPVVRRHQGPPPWLENALDFQRKWESSPERIAGPYVDGERLVVDVRRKQVDAAEALREGVPTLSLGKNLDESVQKGFQVLQDEAILTENQAAALNRFLARELPWVVRT